MPEHLSTGERPIHPNREPSSRTPPSVPDHALLQCIGRGAYGEVWLARNVMGTLRAVKVVYRDTFSEARPYVREFEGIKKFEPLSRTHEGLVDILQIGLIESAGCFYYVMELADNVGGESGKVGEWKSENAPHSPDNFPTSSPARYAPRTLASDLKSQGRLPFMECLRLGISLADAMEYMHQNGLIHRDIKPSNIIFVSGTPKLADIGLVTERGEDKSRVGTEGFIPPEGHGTLQADIFSLGKVLYEVSTGKDRQRFPEPLTLLASLPDQADWLEFNEIVVKACESDSKRRYASAAALRRDLELLRAGQSVRQHYALQRQLARFKKWGAWTAAAILALVGGLLVFQWKSAGEARAARRELLLREVQIARQGARTSGWFDASWEKLREVSRLKPGDDDASTQATACLSGLDARLVAVETNAGSFSLAFSSDGQTLLCAGVTDKTGANAARLWRVPVNQKPGSSRRKENHSTFRGDQSLLTSATSHHDVPPFAHSSLDLRNSELLPVSGDAVAAWKPDGTTNGTPVLFLPSRTNRFVLVEAATGNVLQEFVLEGNPHQGSEDHPVLALTPDARLAAAGLILANVASLPLLGEREGRNSNSISAPSGRFVVWDSVTGRALFQTNELASALAFSPDGRALAVGDAKGRVRVFSVPDFALLAEFPSARVRINCFAFTRDPIVPLAGPLTNAWWLAIGDAGGTIRIWRTASGDRISVCRGSAYDLLALAFHPDGVTLASAGRLDVRFWDAAVGGNPLLRIPNQPKDNLVPDYIHGIAFTPDGNQCALANEQQFQAHFIGLWNLDARRGVQILHGLASLVSRTWLSPDGRWLAALANNWQLAVWELPSGRLRHVFETPQGETADNAGLAFHPSGTSLVFCAKDRVIEWNLSTGTQNRTWPVPRGLSDDVAFDSDGRLWLLRSELPMQQAGFTKWVLRILDPSGSSDVRQVQTDEMKWKPSGRLALAPDQRCFLVSGHDHDDTRWRILCRSLTTGENLWSYVGGPSAIGLTLDPERSLLAHWERGGSVSTLRFVSNGTPVAKLAGLQAPSPGGGAFVASQENGYRVALGRTTDSPSFSIVLDARQTTVGGPVWSHDGQQLAWSMENGSVVVAYISEIRQRLLGLNLPVSSP